MPQPVTPTQAHSSTAIASTVTPNVTPPKVAAARSELSYNPDSYDPEMGYDFAQRHVKQLAGSLSPPDKAAYQGIRPKVGADSFLMVHSAKAMATQTASLSPDKAAYQGVAAKVGADSFLMAHSAKAMATQTASLSPDKAAYQGVAAKVGSDSFMMAHSAKMAASAVNLPPNKAVYQGVPAQVRADSFLMAHSAKVAARDGHTVMPREVSSMSHRGTAPKIGSDSYLMNDYKKKASATALSERDHRVRGTSALASDSFLTAFAQRETVNR